jgi:signal transduction histidine kinase
MDGEQMARENNFKSLQADHLMRLANYYRYHDIDSTTAVNYLLESLKVSRLEKYDYGTARSYAKLATFYTRYKELDLCHEFLDSSAVYYLKTPNGSNNIINYYDEVANKIWDYDPKASMDIYWKGLKYSDTHPKIKISLASAHITLDEPNKALEYLNDALPYLKEARYPRIKGIAFAKLAEIHFLRGDHEATLQACNEGIEHLKTVSVTSQSALPALYRIKGQLFDLKNKPKDAIEYYNLSIKEAYKINELFEVHKTKIALGNFYLNSDLNKAKEYCNDALAGAQKKNFVNLEIASFECLYNIHKNQSNSHQSLYYLEQKNKLQDSVSTTRIRHALDINELKAEKDKEIAIESIQRQIKDEQLKSQSTISKILMISTIVGLFLVGLLSLGFLKIRRQNFKIQNKTEKLIAANDELERSNDELERFAYVASHDLKSPLQTMVSYAGLLKKKNTNNADDKSKMYIDFIEHSGSRMSKLIDDILEYSKLSSKSSSKLEIIDLNVIVDEISQLLNNKYNDKSVSIVASHLPNVKWNQSKIFLLFKNLIENGLKYNDSEVPEVKLYTTTTKKFINIHIEDNGIGISNEYYDKIFVMFNRLHSESKYSGTGLGLATCKKIVNEFKGELTVNSKVGEGSIFNILIPINIIIQ